MQSNSWKKTFGIIWTGQLFSMLSSSIVGFAVVFWLSVRTGSAEVLAYSMLATMLPFILLGMFTGVFVDRWDRRRTMILADSFVAVCSAVLGLMFYFDSVELWQIYSLLALRSIGSAFHAPAMQASVPLLAPKEELMRVAGINQMIHSVSNIAGPALGAMFIAVMDMTWIMMLDVFGAAIACTSLLFVKIPNPDKSEDKIPNVWREIREGLNAMFNGRGLSMLFGCVIVVTFFMMPVSALFPLMTIKYFGGSAFQMGLVEVAWGLGMLAGGALLSIKYMKKANRVMIINLTTITLGASFWLSGLLPTTGYVFFVMLTTFGGISASMYWSAFTVILQTRIDPRALGRVFSIFDSIGLLPSVPGLLATGYIAEHIGLLNAFVIAGGAIFVVGIIACFIPAILKLGKQQD